MAFRSLGLCGSRRLVDSAAMQDERVAIVPECVECAARWLPADEERWQFREVDLDEVAWYCARCADREFG